jgi:hypothetical protein
VSSHSLLVTYLLAHRLDRVAEKQRVKEAIGRSWLLSAKLARKAGYLQTAYSALLQARQNAAPFAFMQSSKLARVIGEPLKGLQELERAYEQLSVELEVIGIVKGPGPKSETQIMQSKVNRTLKVSYAFSHCVVDRP